MRRRRSSWRRCKQRDAGRRGRGRRRRARGRSRCTSTARWYTLRPHGAAPADGVARGAASTSRGCRARCSSRCSRIGDIRTDKRIDFVGGARGTAALEQAVDSGKAAVAFSMYPVTVDDLMAISDAGGIMPPKSTWFEPKLRDGLLIHEI